MAIVLGLALVGCTDYDAGQPGRLPSLYSHSGNYSGLVDAGAADAVGLVHVDTWQPPRGAGDIAAQADVEDIAPRRGLDIVWWDAAGGGDTASFDAGSTDTGLSDAADLDADSEDADAASWDTLISTDIGLDAGSVDAGSPDAVVSDAGAFDSGSVDVGVLDSGSLDGGSQDSGSLDSGPVDVGVLDSGWLDSGSLDSGLVDVGVWDSGSLDSGVLDSGSLDSGSLDSGVLDSGLKDSGVSDTGIQDVGAPDSGLEDTGFKDSGLADTGIQDAGFQDVSLDAVDAGWDPDWGGYTDASFPDGTDIYGGAINSCFTLYAFVFQEACKEDKLSASCVDKSAKEGSAFAQYQFDPVRKCAQANCVDVCVGPGSADCLQECLGKYCTYPFFSCITAGEAGNNDCSQTFSCLQKYEGMIFSIANFCFANATHEAQKQVADFFACGQKPQTDSCVSEIAACWGPAGNDTCVEAIQCSEKCPKGDDVCGFKCIAGADEDGRDKLDKLWDCTVKNCNDCQGPKGCGDPCNQKYCAPEITDCLLDK